MRRERFTPPSQAVITNGARTGRRPRRAFTLFELLIVVSLMTIIAAMAVPRYASSVGRYRADAAARRIAADLGLARAKARANSSPRSVTFNAAAGTYTISGVRHLDRSTEPYTVNLTDAPYYVLLAFADFGGLPQAQFDMYGVSLWDGTVMVKSGDYERTVKLKRDDGSITVN